jgi:hypothetical protein
LIETFLLRLGRGGNTRGARSAIRAMRASALRCDIPDSRSDIQDSHSDIPDYGLFAASHRGVNEIAHRPRRQRLERPAGRQHQFIPSGERED